MNGSEVAELLGLEPLEHEGGLWAQVWNDSHSTGIYFLMQPGDFSALHRLTGPELWHHYAGAAVRMLLLHPDGSSQRPVLGDNLAGGGRPCVPVPGGVWMGAETVGEWSLVGTTMAPPYQQAHFELGQSAALITQYPTAQQDILRLTRPNSQ